MIVLFSCFYLLIAPCSLMTSNRSYHYDKLIKYYHNITLTLCKSGGFEESIHMEWNAWAPSLLHWWQSFLCLCAHLLQETDHPTEKPGVQMLQHIEDHRILSSYRSIWLISLHTSLKLIILWLSFCGFVVFSCSVTYFLCFLIRLAV